MCTSTVIYRQYKPDCKPLTATLDAKEEEEAFGELLGDAPASDEEEETDVDVSAAAAAAAADGIVNDDDGATAVLPVACSSCCRRWISFCARAKRSSLDL